MVEGVDMWDIPWAPRTGWTGGLHGRGCGHVGHSVGSYGTIGRDGHEDYMVECADMWTSCGSYEIVGYIVCRLVWTMGLL